MNFQKLLKEAKKAQQKAAEVQEKLAEMTVGASAAGGLVEVKANGHGRIVSVQIKPEALDPEDVEALEDLILVAIQEAQEKAAELAEKEMGGSLGGMGDMLGGMF